MFDRNLENPPQLLCWSRVAILILFGAPHGVIKLNSDVALKDGGSTVSVAVRGGDGIVCGVFVFKDRLCIPAAAECFDILKAAQVACQEG